MTQNAELNAQGADAPQVLVTGGAGYIGSHTVVVLMEAGYRPVVVDNLSNSTIRVLDRIEAVTGTRPVFYQVDLRDRAALEAVFSEHPISDVIHFAGLKAVGESVAEPLRYYDNNLGGTVVLCGVMAARNVNRIIFSSSATVYGDPDTVPIAEWFPTAPSNPYGRTKLIIENLLKDLHRADPAWRVGILRYFNPAGAHESGLIGEDPAGIPDNLMPYICQVAVGRREELNVFGNDYPTTDGTGVRDFIHVMDLAEGHLAALRKLSAPGGPADQAPWTVNLGTGRGLSVFEMVRAFEEASGRKIPFRITGRRPGDVAECFADPSLAEKLLGWRARRSLSDMCGDMWRWQSGNPRGFAG